MGAAERHWLNAERLAVYPRIFAVLFVGLGLVWVLAASDGVDLKGKPLGYDFITFWGASHLALEGSPAAAYDPREIYLAERLAVPDSSSLFLWHYPPTFFLAVLPLALLPYFWAYLSFVGIGFLLYFNTVRLLVPVAEGKVLMLALAFPGVMINAFHGQNAFITAALVGGALHLLPARPLLAGVLVGLLGIKPHLGVLLPLVLIATRQWTAFFSAAVTLLLFMTASLAVLGVEVWQAFVQNLSLARQLLEEGALPWGKMPTIFAFLRLLDVPVAAAYLVHFAVAVLVAGIVVWTWLRTEVPALRNAALVSGTLLISPYLFDYDLVWLGLAIAWLGVEAWRTGFFRGEREMLAVAWGLPLLVAPFGLLGLQVAPLAVLWMLGFVVLRVRRGDRRACS